MFSAKPLQTPAIIHGLAHEKTAIAKFEEVTGKRVQPCGLHVNPLYPYLGASPDGYIVEEDALIEIKCSYKGREEKITESNVFPYLKSYDGALCLKTNHNYYAQVMGQMGICEKKTCYFVVFTFCDLFIQKVHFDPFYFAYILPKLTNFYDEYYVKEICSKL